MCERSAALGVGVACVFADARADVIVDGPSEDVDYAHVVKTYEADFIGEGRYSPPKIASTEKTPIGGQPIGEYVSTSYVERSNLSMRMGMRRFTRLTNAFSKKLENHCAAVALYVAHYNFVRPHTRLRTTPAMAASVESRMWGLNELLASSESRTSDNRTTNGAAS